MQVHWTVVGSNSSFGIIDVDSWSCYQSSLTGFRNTHAVDGTWTELAQDPVKGRVLKFFKFQSLLSEISLITSLGVGL
jgi:hypothetical protein